MTSAGSSAISTTPGPSWRGCAPRLKRCGTTQSAATRSRRSSSPSPCTDGSNRSPTTRPPRSSSVASTSTTPNTAPSAGMSAAATSTTITVTRSSSTGGPSSRRPSTVRHTPPLWGCDADAGSGSTRGGSRHTRTSIWPTRPKVSGAARSCRPRSSGPASARCATSSRPSSPSRTRSCALTWRRVSASRARPAPARPPSACTAPPGCSMPTATGCPGPGCSSSAPTVPSSTTSAPVLPALGEVEVRHTTAAALVGGTVARGVDSHGHRCPQRGSADG
jgi:hypothetical protein